MESLRGPLAEQSVNVLNSGVHRALSVDQRERPPRGRLLPLDESVWTQARLSDLAPSAEARLCLEDDGAFAPLDEKSLLLTSARLLRDVEFVPSALRILLR